MIDKRYCINLDRRPDRWQLAMAEFEKHSLQVERFPAIDGRDFKKEYPADNGNNGCTLSHYFLVERAKLLGLNAIMIFEDDAQLHDDFNMLLQQCVEALPADWDLLYFGGSHREQPVRINDHIFRVTKTLTTHGYIIRSTLYDEVIKRFRHLEEPVDCLYVGLQPRYSMFVTDPPLAWQRGGFSDICHREMHYDWIKSNRQI